MPPTSSGQITVEKTPNYFVHRQVPARIHRMSPKTKLLLIVRDPSVTKKRSSKPFDKMACIDQNCTVIDTSWSAIKIGLYSKHVKRWLRYFPLQQIHIVSGERLITDPLEEIRQVERFLELRPFVRQDHFFYNSSKGFPCIMKPNHSTYHCLGKNKGRTHLPVSEITMNRLKAFYAPFNKRFYDIVGRTFDW
ncbi:unnamed protein product [Soboliphyme baturini]|uniref:Sulfotransfer_1 domain-containing protein n=1 Tax=Soboliphyme baturini TaxID=241478 RepID=A0A183IAW6_9BILA|nr:unnamed protein product [Soboliphyme baturini]